MAQLNANTPYIQCYIRKEYTGHTDNLEGYIFGVKSMLNRPLHFHFLSEIGAVFWNMPISAFYHGEEFDLLSQDEQERLSLLQTWDCQSNNIAVTTFAFLQNKRVDVHCRDGEWRSGKYLFTIDDYEGDLNELNVGYSNDQDSKCYQFRKWHMKTNNLGLLLNDFECGLVYKLVSKTRLKTVVDQQVYIEWNQ